jgi:hypothetical protein
MNHLYNLGGTSIYRTSISIKVISIITYASLFMCSYVFPFLLLSSFLSFLFLLHFVFFCIYSSDHSSRLKLGNLDGTTPCFEDVWNLRLSSRFVAMNLLPTPYPLRTTIYLHIEVRPFFLRQCYMMLHVQLVICHSISNRCGCFFVYPFRDDWISLLDKAMCKLHQVAGYQRWSEKLTALLLTCHDQSL